MRNNLGTALARLNRYDEAAAVFAEALALKPDGARIHDDLGDALMRLGRAGEAERHFETHARLNPAYGPAAYHLGNAIQEQGRLVEAIDAYRAALALNLGSSAALAHNDLGVALARLGKNLPKRRASFERRCDWTHRSPRLGGISPRSGDSPQSASFCSVHHLATAKR